MRTPSLPLLFALSVCAAYRVQAQGPAATVVIQQTPAMAHPLDDVTLSAAVQGAPAGTTFTYQWKHRGLAIPGATLSWSRSVIVEAPISSASTPPPARVALYRSVLPPCTTSSRSQIPETMFDGAAVNVPSTKKLITSGPRTPIYPWMSMPVIS